MPQHIIVVEYRPEWAQEYASEERKIREILGDNCAAIYHIGSTSVPGLAAKPIIDIMPVVKSLPLVDGKAAEFEKIGYEYLGEFGIPGRRYLRKGGDERTHGEVRDEYARLKKSLAEKFPYDIDAYCDGKDAFVKDLERKALAQRHMQKLN